MPFIVSRSLGDSRGLSRIRSAMIGKVLQVRPCHAAGFFSKVNLIRYPGICVILKSWSSLVDARFSSTMRTAFDGDVFSALTRTGSILYGLATFLLFLRLEMLIKIGRLSFPDGQGGQQLSLPPAILGGNCQIQQNQDRRTIQWRLD